MGMRWPRKGAEDAKAKKWGQKNKKFNWSKSKGIAGFVAMLRVEGNRGNLLLSFAFGTRNVDPSHSGQQVVHSASTERTPALIGDYQIQ